MTFSINQHTGQRVVCRNCQQSPPFEGFDECKECAVAITMDENPGYLEFARRTFADQPQWLAQLEAEWARQLESLAHFARAIA